ncbi:hypothetical protein QP246_10710, partial [Aerococcus urinae]
VRWSAEFSDPLRRDVTGNLRVGAFGKDDLSDMMLRYLKKHGTELMVEDSYFELIELTTFLAADELIFTNDNQLEYMLMDYPPQLQQLVRAKAKVWH